MKKGKLYTTSNMHCKECGAIMPIPRQVCHKRKKNHIKTMYCYRCKKETDFVEERAEDFLCENCTSDSGYFDYCKI